MHPVLLQLGPAAFHSYGVCIILALFASLGVVMALGAQVQKAGVQKAGAQKAGAKEAQAQEAQAQEAQEAQAQEAQEAQAQKAQAAQAQAGKAPPGVMEHVAVFGCCAPIIAMFGARAEYVLFRWREYDDVGHGPFALLTRGGLWWWGAVLSCAVAFVLYALVRKLPRDTALAAADVLVIGFPVAQAFGKLGCLLAGCCYGRPAFHVDATTGSFVADVPFALRFPEGSLAFMGLGHDLGGGGVSPEVYAAMKAAHETVPLFPSQLIEMWLAAAVAVALVLLWRARREKAAGAVVVAYGFALSLCAFLADATRADIARVDGVPLSVAQIIAVLVFAASAAGLVVLRTSWARAPASAP